MSFRAVTAGKSRMIKRRGLERRAQQIRDTWSLVERQQRTILSVLRQEILLRSIGIDASICLHQVRNSAG